MMDVEEHENPKKFAKRIRIKIITNRNLQFITSVRPEATISELANRALSVYLELTGETLLQSTCKKQLTVSAVKQGVFYMPKSQLVSNILNQDDVVEVVIIKAKPKYPNGVFLGQQESSKKEFSHQKMAVFDQKKEKKEKIMQEEEQDEEIVSAQSLIQEIAETKRPQQSVTKRQKKKEKKQLKRSEKKKKFNEKEAKLGSDNMLLEKQLFQQQQIIKEKELLVQILAKKKIKLQKDQIQNSSQKITPQIVIPSPKITFHGDPKMDSPRHLILGQANKKKVNFDVNKSQEEQENTKKTPHQRIVSPMYALKSPFLAQKTPVNNQNLECSGKQKEKEELLNFSLPRKASQDKRYELKKDKNSQPLNDSKPKKQVNVQIIQSNLVKNSIELSEQKNKESKESKNHIISDEQKTSEKIALVKPTKSLVILQPESGSQSEQRKNIEQNIYQNHRFKELSEINSKIKNFIIESDEDE